MQLPPPVHGQSTMNKIVFDSALIRQNFCCKFIPLHFATIGNIGKFSALKSLKMVKYFFIILLNLIFFSPDLVYFTISAKGNPFYRDVIYMTLFKIFRKKIAVHLHAKGIKKEAANSRFKKRLYEYAFNNINIIHLSELLKSDFEGLNINSRFFFLPNGLIDVRHRDTEAQRHKVENPLNPTLVKGDANYPPSESSCLNLLYISNLFVSKGILILLDALAILHKSDLNFNCILAGGEGDISKDSLLSKIDSLELTDKVIYAGAVYGEQKEQLFNKSDVLVFPTLEDCFPLVILEAMQSGLAVISTAEGAIPQIVEDGKNGYVIAKNDANCLSNKILLLNSNSTLLKQMQQYSAQLFTQKYTADKFEYNLLGILSVIIAVNNSSGILKNKIKDPVQWQKDLRSDWDKEL